MAKKTAAPATIEEKMKAALVPAEEQPYAVPENWCWTTVGSICSLIGGGTPSKSNPCYWNGTIPWASVKDIKGRFLFETEDHISEDGLRNSAANVCDVDDLILVTRIEPAKTIIARIPTAINQDLKIVKSIIPSLFLHYYFRTFRQEFEQKASGSTVKGVTVSVVESGYLPLPPLAEQHRIVDRIETMFAKLDEAKEKAQAVIDGYEARRGAILHRAFTGELTEKWRTSPDHISYRKTVSIKSICSSLKYGTASKSIPSGRVAVLRMGNLQGGEIDWTNLVYSDNEEDNEKYKLCPGDVLFNRTNSAEHVGKTSIYRGEQPAIYAGYLIKLDYDHSVIIGDYLNYLLNTPEAREYCNLVKTDAVNQSNINAQKIGAFEIPLVGMDEQREIVRILDDLLAKEAAVKEATETTLATIDTMKQAILSRALRGELGTNDPNDEPAEELLKRVLMYQ